MVIDTSALLAVYFKEPHAAWTADRMKENEDRLMMSTANYTEALIIVLDRQRADWDKFRRFVADSPITLVPPSESQAELAAAARMKYPLNLGDCFAYALAKEEDCPLLALDEDFRNTDVTVVSPGSKSKQ
jgi:ribonuclease VapC